MTLPEGYFTTLRNKKRLHDSYIEFGVFNKCFRRGIQFTDIDGIVESNGHFLILEKKVSGAKIPKGQTYMHRAMGNLGVFTILYYFGYTDADGWPQPGKYTIIHEDHTVESGDCNCEKLQEIIGLWFDKVESGRSG